MKLKIMGRATIASIATAVRIAIGFSGGYVTVSAQCRRGQQLDYWVVLRYYMLISSVIDLLA